MNVMKKCVITYWKYNKTLFKFIILLNYILENVLLPNSVNYALIKQIKGLILQNHVFFLSNGSFSFQLQIIIIIHVLLIFFFFTYFRIKFDFLNIKIYVNINCFIVLNSSNSRAILWVIILRVKLFLFASVVNIRQLIDINSDCYLNIFSNYVRLFLTWKMYRKTEDFWLTVSNNMNSRPVTRRCAFIDLNFCYFSFIFAAKTNCNRPRQVLKTFSY